MQPIIKITGDLNGPEIQEILMTVRAIERRDPKKNIAVLVDDAGLTADTAAAMMSNLFEEQGWFAKLRRAN